MKLVWAFLVGLLCGAGVVTLVPRWHPSPAVRVLQDSATAARAVADDSAAIARAAIDSLNAWRPIVAGALARPRRISVGVIPGTVVIAPIAPADTERTVTVPPEVVDQLVQDQQTINDLREGWARASAAVARLEGAARADTVADRLAAAASLAAIADLQDQLRVAQRSARWWKIGGAAALVLITVREVGKLAP